MRYYFSILALLPALANGAIAAEAAETEQIVVTGMRYEQSALQSPAPVFVIDREQITLSGARQLSDLLQAQAGIQVRDTIGDGGRGVVLAMRGFGENAANNTLVLVDGRRLNNPNLQPPDLNSIALKDVERVEVLAGGAGVLFGEQAVGGVVNVVTRDGGGDSTFVEAGVGSHDTSLLQAAYSTRLENGLGIRVSAQSRESDNYRDNNESEYLNLMSRISYAWERGKVFAEYQYVDDQLRFPGALPATLAAKNRRQTLNPDDFGDLETQTWRTGGSLAISGNWRLIAEASWRDSEGQGFQSAANTSDMEVWTLNPRLVGEYELSRGLLQFTAGLDLTDSEYLLDIPDFFFRTDYRQELKDAYAQLVFPLAQQLRLTAGIRASKVDDHDRSNGRRNNDSETLGTAGLSWHINDQMRLLLRRDDTLRYANVDENGFTLPAIEFLGPQDGESWELGYEWFNSEYSLQAVAYRLELEDEILYDPSAAGPGAEFGFLGANVNLDRSRREGASLSGQWQASESLQFRASYNWTDAEIRAGSFRGRTIPFVAEHTASLALAYRFNALLTLYGESIYTGSRHALGDDANLGPSLDDYLLFNANLGISTGNWRAALRVNNIGNEEYDTLGTLSFGVTSVYPAPERTWMATLSYTF